VKRFLVFFRLRKPNPAANIVVQFVRADVEQASLLNRPLEGLLVVKIGAGNVGLIGHGTCLAKKPLVSKPAGRSPALCAEKRTGKTPTSFGGLSLMGYPIGGLPYP
jgi:hypothetical protein